MTNAMILMLGHDNLTVQGYTSSVLARDQGLRCNNSGVIHEIPGKTPEKQTLTMSDGKTVLHEGELGYGLTLAEP